MILTEKEFNYLKGVIKPFITKVKSIQKRELGYTEQEYIRITLVNDDYFDLPYFNENEHYKNMGLEKEYTLLELEFVKEVE